MQTVELYHIFGNDLEYFITSAPRDYVYLGNTYTTTTLERNSQSYQAELTVAKMQINLAYSSTYSVLFNTANSFKKIQITLTKLFISETVTPYILFNGYINSCSVADGLLQITALSMLDELNRQVPKLNYQPMCNHTLFDINCGLSAAVFAIDEPDALFVNTIIYGKSTKDSGYFTYGKIFNIATQEYRMIIAHEKTSEVFNGITYTAKYYLTYEMNGNSSGCTIYPGCNKTPDQVGVGCINCCQTFNNINNYLGFPYMPAGSNSNVTKTIEG